METGDDRERGHTFLLPSHGLWREVGAGAPSAGLAGERGGGCWHVTDSLQGRSGLGRKLAVTASYGARGGAAHFKCGGGGWHSCHPSKGVTL